MKIAIVTGIFPPDHGGPASYVPRIASGLMERGHHISAVMTLSDRIDHDDRGYGFPVLRLPRHVWKPLRWVRTILAIRRAATEADVVYLNGLVMEGIVASRLLSRRAVAVKVVGDLIWEKARNAKASSSRLDDFATESLPLRWRLLRWLQGRYTGCSDAVIVPSRYLAGIVRRWGVEGEKIHVVYNAVETQPSAGRGEGSCDLVTVARLVAWKGLDRLIEVAAANGWSLRIVGEGPLRGALEQLARRLHADVSFAGHVPQAQVADEIRRGRLFVLNSSYEGLPHIVLEAKSAGVAVVATEAGGTPETIEHGVDGWLVPAADDAALEASLRRLLSDDILRARLAQQGRASLSKFSLQAMFDQTEAVLLRVAAGSAR